MLIFCEGSIGWTSLAGSRRVALLEGVTVLYETYPALARCDFDAYEGEVIFLRGPNGSGKTTLLKCLAGLVEVARGTAVVFGRDLRTERVAIRREVAYLAHAYQMYDDLTANENLAFFASVAGIDLAVARSVARDLGLLRRDLAARFSLLSAGQRKKLSISVTLARPAELLLFDEPHALLDGQAKAILDDSLRVAANAGRTVVVASHELDRVSGLADRSYILHNGTSREAEKGES